MRIFKHNITLNLFSLIVIDIGFISLSIYISQYLVSESVYRQDFYQKVGLNLSIIILILHIGNLYDLRQLINRKELISKTGISFFVIFIIDFTTSLFVRNLYASNMEIVVSNFISMVMIFLVRYMYFRLINGKKLREKVLIIGNSNNRILREIENGNYPGIEIVGYVEGQEKCKKKTDFQTQRVNLEESIKKLKPNVVVVALSERRGKLPADIILDCKFRGIKVEDLTTFYERLTGKILIENLRPSWLIFSDGFSRNYFNSLTKRLVDTSLSLIGLAVSFPLMVCVGLLTKLDSPGPIIFRQERVGEKGRVFTLYKFRTMVADAEKVSGPVWSQTADPRVTRLGKILRRTGMDEIPQLFNVLKGDMSFVGPRPERPHFVEQLQQQIPYYAQRLVVKPGITGWAQVRYGYGATLEDAVEKLQYDLYYIKNMSFFLDIIVILSTIHKVFFARVALEETNTKKNVSDVCGLGLNIINAGASISESDVLDEVQETDHGYAELQESEERV